MSAPATEVRFHVGAVPVPQPRPRVVNVRGRAMAISNPKKHPITAFKMAVRAAAKKAHCGSLLSGALFLHVTFYMPRPQRMLFKRRPMVRCPHTCKPDLDNLVKAIKDCLSGLVWHDDAQVCYMSCAKLYVASGDSPGASVTIRTYRE
jgi:Holliday junction resolvase RusA-like endonuclease